MVRTIPTQGQERALKWGTRFGLSVSPPYASHRTGHPARNQLPAAGTFSSSAAVGKVK